MVSLFIKLLSDTGPLTAAWDAQKYVELIDEEILRAYVKNQEDMEKQEKLYF
jgi:hypothetical protein